MALPLTPGDGQDLLERYKRAWESRNPDLAMELYRDDADIRAIWNDVAASQTNVEFDAERVWVVDRTVLASWHVAFTRRANADRVRVRAFTTFELDDAGLIARQKQWGQMRVVGTDSTIKPEA